MHYVSKISLAKQFIAALILMMITPHTYGMDVVEETLSEGWEIVDGVNVPAPAAMVDFNLPGGLNIEAAKKRQKRFREAGKHDQLQNDIGVNIVTLERKMNDSFMKPMKDKNHELFLATIAKIRYINSEILPEIKEAIAPFIQDQIKKFMEEIINPNNRYIIPPNTNETTASILTQIKCITSIKDLKKIVSEKIYKKLTKNSVILGLLTKIVNFNEGVDKFIRDSLSEEEYHKTAFYIHPVVTFHQKIVEISDLEEKILKILAPFGLTKDHLEVFIGFKPFSREELTQGHLKRYPSSLTNPQHMTTTTTIPEETSSEESARQYRGRHKFLSLGNPGNTTATTTAPEMTNHEKLKKALEGFLQQQKSTSRKPASSSANTTTTTTQEEKTSPDEEKEEKRENG